MPGKTVVEYSASKPTPAVLCPNCGSYCPVAAGSNLGDDNQRRIAELEAQLNLLKKKVTDSDSKIADYEDELRKVSGPTRTNTAGSTGSPVREPPTAQSRFGSFLNRKPSASDAPPSTPLVAPGSTSLFGRKEPDLQAALAREQEARQQAEGKVSQLSSEMEDLSAQLFQQANEMVASERRARAKLEERVEILEKRDVEKRKRLERLEGALKRIDRVKELLGT